MIRAFVIENGRLTEAADPASALERAVWIDLLRPEEPERVQVGGALGIELPSREDMQEIEFSSRLYREDGALVMTAVLLANAETDHPETDPVTFVLHEGRLVTLRFIEPRAFELYRARGRRDSPVEGSGAGVLAGLLDAVVDRLADTLEYLKRETDRISREVFRPPQPERAAGDRLRILLRDIGRRGDLVSDIRESLLTLQRLVLFWRNSEDRPDGSKMLLASIETLSKDLGSLADHAGFLAHEINFLLSATLGFINIEQNSTIKIFSVIAVIFLPPTLVASVYGMNFAYMPELSWRWGYPFALLLMLLAAILPYRWFRYRGWL